MSQSASIVIQELSFTLPTGHSLLSNVTLAFHTQKVGLIGRNGIGKSVLLKLIAKEFLPTLGFIRTEGSLIYVPQNHIFSADETIANFLGFEKKIAAFRRITEGSLDENDFAVLQDEWDIFEKFQYSLKKFGLEYLCWNQPASYLSGGEKTRLALTKAFLSEANFILLDEPSNHLDSTGRQLLYEAIQAWSGGMIVASHDRALLNLMEQIVELSQLGVTLYGGNYTAYSEQKQIETEAAHNLLQARRELVKNAKQLAQTRRERHEQNEAKGKRAKQAQIRAKGCYDKIEFKSAQGKSENTNRRIRLQADRKISAVEAQLETAREKIEILDSIHVTLPMTHVPNGKIILKMTDLSFTFLSFDQAIIQDFNLLLTGPERIALVGGNGSGKTALVKLILQELMPQSGEIYLGTKRICYVDQAMGQLNPEISILENFLHFNPECSMNEAYLSLAKFMFKNIASHKLIKQLSGGEKLRVLLACMLLSSEPPQLLILDEPTNHLDLQSVENIERILKQFEGAMIVISHDQHFLEKIGIGRRIAAPFVDY